MWKEWSESRPSPTPHHTRSHSLALFLFPNCVYICLLFVPIIPDIGLPTYNYNTNSAFQIAGFGLCLIFCIITVAYNVQPIIYELIAVVATSVYITAHFNSALSKSNGNVKPSKKKKRKKKKITYRALENRIAFTSFNYIYSSKL